MSIIVGALVGIGSNWWLGFAAFFAVHAILDSNDDVILAIKAKKFEKGER